MSAVKVGQFDVSALAEKLQDESLYGLYPFRKYTDVHNDMTDIWVRYNDISNFGEHFNDEHTSVWYPIITQIPEVLPIVMGIMQGCHGERLGGVLITKLPAGGRIEPHIDEGWHAEYYQKFYVAIQNDKGCLFCWDDMTVEAEVGEVYEFDNSVNHWVENNSDRDRIALIVCIKTLASAIGEIRSDDD